MAKRRKKEYQFLKKHDITAVYEGYLIGE